MSITFQGVDPELYGNLSAEVLLQDVADIMESDGAKAVLSVVASGIAQNYLEAVRQGYLWVKQDDEHHDTCTLIACLNPLHPGPCKGWKHNLFQTAPEAYHALEAKRVEQANAKRLKKIQDLKSQGKPIPKKLLTPIVAKPHPLAGQTAVGATGEAHAAGKAVSEAAGIKVSVAPSVNLAKEPGKVSLGKAAKTVPATLGPKGKKPTLASKG